MSSSVGEQYSAHPQGCTCCRWFRAAPRGPGGSEAGGEPCTSWPGRVSSAPAPQQHVSLYLILSFSKDGCVGTVKMSTKKPQTVYFSRTALLERKRPVCGWAVACLGAPPLGAALCSFLGLSSVFSLFCALAQTLPRPMRG